MILKSRTNEAEELDKKYRDLLPTETGKFFNFSRGGDMAELRGVINKVFGASELLQVIKDKILRWSL